MPFLITYYICWIALVGIMTANLKLEVKLESPSSVLWLILIGIFALPALFDPFNADSSVLAVLGGPSQDLRNNPVLIKAQVFAIVFSFTYYLVRISLANSEYRQVDRLRVFTSFDGSSETERSLLFLTIVLTLGLVLLLLSVATSIGLSGVLDGTYGSFRLEANGPLKMASYFLILAFSGSLLIAVLARKWKYLFLIVFIIVLVFLAGRTRQLIAPAALGVFYFVLFRYQGPKQWLSIIGLSIVGMVGLLFLQFFRYQGSISESFYMMNTADFYVSFYQSLLVTEGEASVRHYFYYLLRPETNFEGFREATSYRRLLLFFVPGTLLKAIGIGDIKPVDMNTLLYQDYFGEGLGIVATAHPLIFGDAFANLGWLGILFGGMLALLSSGTNLFIRMFPWAWRIVIFSYFGYIFVMIARGGVYNSISGMVFPVVFYLVLYRAYRRLFRVQ